MDPVIIVSGNWVKKNRYVFNTDNRGCIVLHLDEKTTHEELVKLVLDDYGLKERSHQVKLTYMFSNKTLKNMANDTPPCNVSNTRQLQGFLSLRKIDQLRLCVEITEKEDIEISRREGSRDKKKRPFSHVSKLESRDEDYGEGYDDFCYGYSSDKKANTEEDDEEDEDEEIRDDNYMDRASKNQDEKIEEEEEEDDEEDEEDEFNSRFDVFDDSDGASSEDDNFSAYGEPPKEDENSPNLPPKKRPQNIAMGGSKGDSEVLRLEMSSLNLAVKQRYQSKNELEKRLKLLTVRDGFDFDVPVSNSRTLIVKCWVDGCRWRVRASTQGESPEFYVRIYDSEHTCSVTERSNRSRQATPDILGALYRDFLGDVNPSVKPRSVGIIINKHFGIKVITILRLTYIYITTGLSL